MKHAIGTHGWFIGEGTHSKGGVVDTILDLLIADEISQDKARELIQYATCPHTRAVEPLPAAPWECVADIHERREWKESLPNMHGPPEKWVVDRHAQHQTKPGPRGGPGKVKP